MRDLVALSIVANVTLVEPFMYESMALHRLCTPSAFRAAGLQPQPASAYLNVTHLARTRHFVPFASFARDVSNRAAAADDDAITVSAALYFIWDVPRATPTPSPSVQLQPPATADRALFFRCDSTFHGVPYNRTARGWQVAVGMYARHAVCFDGRGDWVRPVTSVQFLSRLFDTVRAMRPDEAGDTPASVVTINYRKYVLERLQRATESLPKLPPAPPSALGMRVATAVIARSFPDAPFVAIQLRTGRTMATLRHKAFPGRSWEGSLARGVVDAVNALFRRWVFDCADTLIDAALQRASELSGRDGGRVAFYLASDIYNDGWKNGEYETADTRDILDRVDAHFKERLAGRVVRFDPAVHEEVRQDVMGLSAVADISVAYLANAFVSHRLSTVGRHIADVRKQWRNASSVLCECPEPHDDDIVSQ